VQLKTLTTEQLWEKWKKALEEWGDIPQSLARIKALNEIEDEIIERIHAARADRLASKDPPKLWNR